MFVIVLSKDEDGPKVANISQFEGVFSVGAILLVGCFFAAGDLDDLVLRVRLADFDLQLDRHCEVAVQRAFGLEFAPSLMFLDQGIQPLPAAKRMHAACGQVVDDVQRDEVFLQFSFSDGALAEWANLVDGGPVFDADVAKGVAGLERSTRRRCELGLRRRPGRCCT